MKQLLIAIAFLFSITCSYSQGPVAPGEYDCYFINPAGKLFNLTAGLPTAMNVPAALTWKYAAGGLHNGAAIDNLGHVWTLGDNSGGVGGNGSTAGGAPSQVMTDSSGKVFDSAVQVALWVSQGTGVFAVRADGSLWVWGNLAWGMRGNGSASGTWTRPVRVIIPGGRKVTKVCVNSIAEVLCSDGTVWAWGGWTADILGTKNGDINNPHQVILPQAAKDIAGGGQWSYAVGVNGTLYGWGYYNNAMFGSYTGGAITTPLDLTKYMGFPLPVAKVYVNTVASYFILTDGGLWSCGDNIVGSLANGHEANQAASPYPYAVWPDPGATNQLLEPVPTHILPGVKFSDVYVATADVFYFYAKDSSGQLYSAGRNKGGVVGNGVVECDLTQGLIGAARPNSWDVTTLTPVNPLALKAVTKVTSPYCLIPANQTTSPCNLCPVANQPPVANAGPAQVITLPASSVTLDGSASTDPDGKVVSYTWMKTGGPRGDSLSGTNAAKIQAFFLQPGIYTYQLTVSDNSGATSTAQMSITVNPALPCPTPRLAIGVTVTINGSAFSVPLSWVKIAYGDGSTQ